MSPASHTLAAAHASHAAAVCVLPRCNALAIAKARGLAAVLSPAVRGSRDTTLQS